MNVFTFKIPEWHAHFHFTSLESHPINKIEYFPIACGGMDNMCTVYDVNNRDASGAAKIVRELAGYEGFLSSCRFLDDTHIVTGSGDMKICVWDLQAGKKTAEMDGHEGDVVIYLFLFPWNWLKCKLQICAVVML